MKILKSLFFLFFISNSLFGFLAENDSRFLFSIDNPASLNILSHIEVSEELYYNNFENDIFLYKQQIVLPSIFIFKPALNFSGVYENHIVRFEDYNLYLSTGLWKVFNIGLSYEEKQFYGGILLNLKYFSIGGKLYNLDLNKQNDLTYDHYSFGLSVLIPLADNFLLKINSDYILYEQQRDIVHSGIMEMLTIGVFDLTLKQNLYFDHSYFQYNLGGSLNYKGVSVYYEESKTTTQYENKLGVKFFFDQVQQKRRSRPKSIFLFSDNQSNKEIIFEPLFKDKNSVRYWKIDIFNRVGDIVKTIDHIGDYPDKIKWNFIDAFGKRVVEGKYVAVFSVITKNEKMFTSNQLTFFVNSVEPSKIVTMK